MKKEAKDKKKISIVTAPAKMKLSLVVKPKEESKKMSLSVGRKSEITEQSMKLSKSNGQLQIDIKQIENPIANGKTSLLPVMEKDDLDTQRSISQDSIKNKNVQPILERKETINNAIKESIRETLNKNIKKTTLEEINSPVHKSIVPLSVKNSVKPDLNGMPLLKGRITREPTFKDTPLNPTTPKASTYITPMNFTMNDFMNNEVGGTMQVRVISRFRPLNQTEKVKYNYN